MKRLGNSIAHAPTISVAASDVRRPMFEFGDIARAGAPLAIVSGGLILDLGEAERTFIYRCQDRFLAYTSLWAERSVFFVASERHAEIYRRQFIAQRARFDRIRERTGLFAATPLLAPLYVGCDIDSLTLFPCRDFSAQLEALPAVRGFLLNQISPTYAKLLAQLAGLLRQHGVAIDAVEADAAELA